MDTLKDIRKMLQGFASGAMEAARGAMHKLMNISKGFMNGGKQSAAIEAKKPQLTTDQVATPRGATREEGAVAADAPDSPSDESETPVDQDADAPIAGKGADASTSTTTEESKSARKNVSNPAGKAGKTKFGTAATRNKKTSAHSSSSKSKGS